MKSENKAINRLTDVNSKVSSHFFIKKNGEAILMVPLKYTAWHVGKSKWKKFNLLNKYSVGIEIQNPGHTFEYPAFNKKQILSLLKLCKFLKKKLNINKNSFYNLYSQSIRLAKQIQNSILQFLIHPQKNLLIYQHNLIHYQLN